MKQIDENTWEYEGFEIKAEEKPDRVKELYTVLFTATKDEDELYATSIGLDEYRNNEPAHLLDRVQYNYEQVEKTGLVYIMHEIHEHLKDQEN